MIHQFKGLGLVVGIEEGFTGERYIRRRFGQDVPDVPILGSLVQTCKAAISVATRDWNLCQDCGQWVHSVDSCIYGEGEPGNEYRIYCETCNPGE
jgi:hypothetical protein